MAFENTADNTLGKPFQQHRNDGCSGSPFTAQVASIFWFKKKQPNKKAQQNQQEKNPKSNKN